MRRTRILLAGTLLQLSWMGWAGIAYAADPFYTGMLRDGIQAYDRKDYATAARELRLACFGMLDEPKPLAGCLIRLAVAQDREGNSVGFGDTFRLLLDVEEQFGGYSQAEVPPDLRAALEQRLVATMPASTLESVAAFRGLAARQKQATLGAPGTAGTKTTPAGRNERRRETPPQVAPAEPAPAVTTGRAAPAGPPAAPRAVSDEERQKMAMARQILDGEGKTRDLKRAFQLAREVADAHAEAAETQHLAAEAAYRLSRWQDAAAYFRRAGEPGADQPELLFYMAVALYESGDKTAAAGALQRSLPNLQKTPYVESYAKKILGS
jgi:tetratricopeptide (TPR) repeat protein